MAKDPLGPTAFRDAALRHLSRYACSRVSLRRVLQRRVTRLARAGQDAGEGIGAVIESLLDDLTAQGLLNDLLFAEGRARSLAERGLAARMIGGKLAQLGVDDETTRHALAHLALEQGRDGEGPSDRAAAMAYARRRRLGPWRVANAPPLDDPKARAKQRDKDLRALASRGFSLDLARNVLAGTEEND